MPNFLTIADLDSRETIDKADIVGYQKTINSIWYWGKVRWGKVAEWIKGTKHIVADTNEPPFLNSWANYGAPNTVASFRKTIFEEVFLFGCVKNGIIGNAIYQLPAGYRPAVQVKMAITSNGAYGHVTVQTDGYVVCNVGNNASVWLDGVHFNTDLAIV